MAINPLAVTGPPPMPRGANWRRCPTASAGSSRREVNDSGGLWAPPVNVQETSDGSPAHRRAPRGAAGGCGDRYGETTSCPSVARSGSRSRRGGTRRAGCTSGSGATARSSGMFTLPRTVKADEIKATSRTECSRSTCRRRRRRRVEDLHRHRDLRRVVFLGWKPRAPPGGSSAIPGAWCVLPPSAPPGLSAPGPSPRTSPPGPRAYAGLLAARSGARLLHPGGRPVESRGCGNPSQKLLHTPPPYFSASSRMHSPARDVPWLSDSSQKECQGALGQDSRGPWPAESPPGGFPTTPRSTRPKGFQVAGGKTTSGVLKGNPGPHQRQPGIRHPRTPRDRLPVRKAPSPPGGPPPLPGWAAAVTAPRHRHYRPAPPQPRRQNMGGARGRGSSWCPIQGESTIQQGWPGSGRPRPRRFRPRS